MSTQKKGRLHHLGTVLDYDNASSLREALENCNTYDELDWKTYHLDTERSQEETLSYELKRLQALKSYLILDTDRKACFERFTALAARIFDVPICLVSLVDLGRQWFASNRGLGDVRETPRKVAFCSHTILSNMDIMIVKDTLKDPRFVNNGLVTGDPNIRFYAGAPLITKDGYKLGTVCIIDTNPRPNGLTLSEKQTLREIAALTMAQIEDTKVALEKAQMSQAKLMACAAHDLITPLTSIQLNIGFLSEDQTLLKIMNDDQQEILRNTKECVDIMSNICLHSMQTFRGTTKSNTGLSELENHKDGMVNIEKLLKSLDNVFRSYGANKVPINIRVDEDVPVIIKSDVISVFRSSLNLLTNACNITESGSIDFHLYIKHASAQGCSDKSHCDSIVFECTNTGSGIDNKSCVNLFTDGGGLYFGQEDGASCLGLGLHLITELMKGLGGNYGYHERSCNDDQTGSVFWFSIPLVLPNDELNDKPKLKSIKLKYMGDSFRNLQIDSKLDLSSEISRTKTNNLMAATTKLGSVKAKLILTATTKLESVKAKLIPGKRKSQCTTRGKCVLVIDDSTIIRKVIDRAFKNFGFDVIQAENGLQGLEEMKTTLFDVVLCDFLMPIMDGMDCVKQYRQWESSHRPWFKQYIVGISAHADDNDSDRGLNIGMNKFIPKPLSIKVLRELVDSDGITETSKKLDSLVDDSNAIPYFLHNANSASIDLGTCLSSSDEEVVSSHPMCLIVEDSATVSKAMMRCIQRHDWKTRLAKDGEEAVRLLEKRNWDAVFMDDQLPLMTGSACVTKFRHWERKNRVARQMNLYMCSANPYSIDNPPEGFDGVLSKPFTPSSLISILDKCTRMRSASLL